MAVDYKDFNPRLQNLKRLRIMSFMYTVTKEIYFCYGHRLPGYKGKCRRLHGHSGKVEIELATETLDALGMVIDFEKIKRTVKTWIDENLDHRMLLCEKDPLVPVLKKMKEPVFVLKCHPTAENIARMIYEFAAKSDLPVVKVRLWETPTSYATYAR